MSLETLIKLFISVMFITICVAIGFALNDHPELLDLLLKATAHRVYIIND